MAGMMLIPWWENLPKPIDPAKQQELRSLNALRQMQMQLAYDKLRFSQQESQADRLEKQQARNALAQLLTGQTPGAGGNALSPAGMDVQREALPALPGMGGGEAGGVAPMAPAAGNALAPTGGGVGAPSISPQAMAAAIAAGANPSAVISLGTMGSTLAAKNLELQQKQQQLDMAARKAKLEAANTLYDRLGAALLPEYEDNLKKYGPERALSLYNENGNKLLGELKRSGDFAAIAADIGALGPPAQLRANATSVKDYYDALAKQERSADNKPEYQGTVTIGGKAENAVPLLYGPGGFVDARTRQPVPPDQLSGVHKIGTKAEVDAEAAGIPTGPTNLQGEEYLKALPASRAAMIRGYAEGRIGFPGSFSLRSPYWQKMVADITQYDPSFDAVNYNARAQARKDFTSGKSAQNITSFNTAIGHLGTLDKAAEGLANTWSPAWNTVANMIETGKGNPRVVNFDVAKNALAAEMTRAFRGTGGNVYDIQEWSKTINSSNSPQQLKAAVRQATDLLHSRIDAIGEQYKRGMGTTADVMDLLSPAAKKTLARLEGTGDEAVAAPKAASEEKPAPEGTVVENARGEKLIKRNGKWEPLP